MGVRKWQEVVPDTCSHVYLKWCWCRVTMHLCRFSNDQACSSWKFVKPLLPNVTSPVNRGVLSPCNLWSWKGYSNYSCSSSTLYYCTFGIRRKQSWTNALISTNLIKYPLLDFRSEMCPLSTSGSESHRKSDAKTWWFRQKTFMTQTSSSTYTSALPSPEQSWHACS